MSAPEAEVFDGLSCELGEGPLWHPGEGRLYWFDILGRRMHASDGRDRRSWEFDAHPSAAALTSDPARLLVAAGDALLLIDPARDARERIADLETEGGTLRPNDGLADPWGGFWIGTLLLEHGPEGRGGSGAIWRWRGGEMRRLHAPVPIPNAICFDATRALAFWADTDGQVIFRQPVHSETGWPEGEAEPHIDLRGTDLKPDGARIDAEGVLWNAQWGAGRVAAYDPEGRFLRAIPVPAPHASCPAFGGADLSTLFVTTAREGLPPERLADPAHGRTYAIRGAARGRPEPRVLL